MKTVKEPYFTYGDCGLEQFARNVHRMEVLPEAHFDFFELYRLTFLANYRLASALRLTNRLLEELIVLGYSNSTGLLHFAVKPTEQVFGGFFRVFTGYLYHRCIIVADRSQYCNTLAVYSFLLG